MEDDEDPFMDEDDMLDEDEIDEEYVHHILARQQQLYACESPYAGEGGIDF